MINDNENEYNNMQIDKQNLHVSYNDKAHKYWTNNSNQSCISVTTLIHKFTTFDEDFWASYKALESMLEENDFKSIKSTLLDTKKFNLDTLKELNISEDTFNEAKTEILQEWANKREASCIRGTKIHLEHELGHLDGVTPEIQQLGLGGVFKPKQDNNIILGDQSVYPELLLSYIDDTLKLAGQADLVIVDGDSVYILDYKSNKEIKKTSFYDKKKKKSEMMKYPLNNLQDVNFWHYTLQLSTYAWMIEKALPDAKIKNLILIHYDHDGHCTPYECEYLKKDVERMLNFYKKEIEHDEFVKSRTKIKF